MKKLLVSLSLLASVLAGCSTASPPSTSTPQPTATADLSRTDDQGAISVTVKPVNLNDPGQTLDFEISLNTHSVDLSMDLAALASLTTDTGITIQPAAWDAPRGGHHVAGKLSFTVRTDGKALLEKATRLTLTLQNIDVPERSFEWELGK